MAALVLPNVVDVPHYTFSTELDGVTFRFEFRWNDRASAWFMSLRDVNGNDLVVGRRVVVGFPLLTRFSDPRLPKGDLNAVDTTGTGTEPGINDLGGRVKLIYMTADEIPAELRG
jgi:hypothetical protein